MRGLDVVTAVKTHWPVHGYRRESVPLRCVSAVRAPFFARMQCRNVDRCDTRMSNAETLSIASRFCAVHCNADTPA